MFFLATELGGLTVQELEDKLDYQEFVEWVHYFKWRREKQEAATEQVKRDAKNKSPTGRGPKRPRKAKKAEE